MITKEWLEDYKLKAESIIELDTDIARKNLAKIILSLVKEIEANPVENRVSQPSEPIEAGWIDSKKELPNNNRFVIIYWDNGYHNEMNVASYDALDMQWYDHNRESFTDDVTYWREFPPKP